MSTTSIRLSIIYLALLIADVLSAQVPFKPLYEVFTSATCAPCVAFNGRLDSLLHDNPSTYALIKYQVNWPGVGDPYYITENGTRVNYYGVNQAPILRINNEDTGIDDINQATHDMFLEELTFMEIEIPEATIDDNNIVNISVDVRSLSDYPAGLKAHVSIVEKRTVNNFATNGEEEFLHVNLKMLPGVNGTTLGAMTNGSQETFTLSYDMNNTFMETANDLAVVVFIQDDSNKSIIQSESKDIEGDFEVYDLTFNVMDENGNPLEGAEIYLDNSGPLETDINGMGIYQNVLKGNISYSVSFPSLETVAGIANLEDSNITENIILVSGDYLIYEPFNNSQPSGWTTHVLGAGGFDDVVWNNNSIIFSSLFGVDSPLYLTTPVFDLSQHLSGSIIFNMQAPIGAPVIGFGTIEDQDDFSTITEIEELIIPSTPTEYTYDISGMVDANLEAIQFYWYLKPAVSVFATLNYFIITNGVTTNSQDLVSLKNVKFSPNPVTENMIIESDIFINSVEIYNYMGQLIKQINNNSANNIILNFSDYSKGTYIAVLYSDLGKIAKPFIVE